MRAEAYAAYLQTAGAGYAEDNVTSGRWPREGALERSLAEHEALLPLGVATPGHHLFEILNAEGGPAVGYLWFAVQEGHGVRSAFIYDVEIKPEFRRQGHARRAFQALEEFIAALNLSSICLHVFANNPSAQALYRELGFAATGINMRKQVGGKK